MQLIYPMGLLAIFTLLYAGLVLATRIKAYRQGDVKARYLREFTDDTPPSYMQKPTRHWSNLFELPVLFYAVCLTILVLNLSDTVFIYLAWSFFVMRLIHALIHTTYNHVLHRLGAFIIGHLIILAMWVRLLMMVPAS
ncbi:MAPEG family protein [Paremcibacter congregatus]|nr:MAPEG family protein [Paremcibacter congregatus]